MHTSLTSQANLFFRYMLTVFLDRTASDERLGNRNRYPTTVVTGPSGYSAIGRTVIAMFHHYGWTRGVLFCDQNSRDPDDILIMGMACNQLKATFGSTPEFNVAVNPIDTSRPETILPAMTIGKSHSSSKTLTKGFLGYGFID